MTCDDMAAVADTCEGAIVSCRGDFANQAGFRLPSSLYEKELA